MGESIKGIKKRTKWCQATTGLAKNGGKLNIFEASDSAKDILELLEKFIDKAAIEWGF